MDPNPSQSRALRREQGVALAGVKRREMEGLLARLTDAVRETAALAAAARGGADIRQALAAVRLTVRLGRASARLASAYADAVHGRFTRMRYCTVDGNGRLLRSVTRRTATKIPAPRKSPTGSTASPRGALHLDGSNSQLPPPRERGRGTAQGGGGGTLVAKGEASLSPAVTPPPSAARKSAASTPPLSRGRKPEGAAAAGSRGIRTGWRTGITAGRHRGGAPGSRRCWRRPVR